MKSAIILFAHGSRDPAWAEPMRAIQQAIRARAPETPVLLAFLECMTPDLTSATRTLVELGVDQITLLPLFLGIGKHARQDLPELLAQLRCQYPQVQWDLRPSVGEEPAVVNLLAELVLQPACSGATQLSVG